MPLGIFFSIGYNLTENGVIKELRSVKDEKIQTPKNNANTLCIKQTCHCASTFAEPIVMIKK